MKKLIIIIEIIAIMFLVSVQTPEAEQKYFLLTSTAYYPGAESCYPFDDGLTAIGHKAGYGSIAIDPKNGPLKMEQRVYIEGYGHGVCNDVGGAIKGWRIDVCFNTYEEAVEWGVKLVKVYVQ